MSRELIKVGEEITEVGQAVDKMPFESKKFWALLVSISAVFVVLLVATFITVNPDLAAHAMDTVVWLSGIYITGQASQDVMKAFKGKQ